MGGLLRHYVRGQVICGTVYYEKENNNQTTNLQDAGLFTQKQCHKWMWDMRKNNPNASWGYWPIKFQHTTEMRVLDV